MAVKIRCKLCGDVLVSKHRHDFVMCKCGSCYLDGGGDPYYRIGGDPENYEDLNCNNLDTEEKGENA